MASTFERAIEMVKRVPEGEVSTYGQIAYLISGTRRGARVVGYALAALDEAEAECVPWWRIINAKGRISISHLLFSVDEQRRRLESEGIEFDENDRVDLSRYGWDGPPGFFWPDDE